MITIAVVDSSAESRNRIIQAINDSLSLDASQLHFFPRLSIKPLAPEELKFHSIPDICIIGPRILKDDLTFVAQARRLFPNTPILAKTAPNLESLSVVEHLARLGANDILQESLAPSELLRKLILHARSSSKQKSGKLIIVDSGKGGLGVTSVVAALGESLLEEGKRVLLVDLDFDSQDLTRFLQARPFINENLSTLLSQNKAILQESVEDCLVQVWCDAPDLSLMPPPPDADEFHDSQSSVHRTFVSIFEVLDSIFDVVIVDCGACRGVLKNTLYRIADHVVFVVGNDPASLYASVDHLKSAFASMSPLSKLWVIQNAICRIGLPSNLLSSELRHATKLDGTTFIEESIPFSRNGAMWPGSGGTLYSSGSQKFNRTFRKLTEKLCLSSDNGNKQKGTESFALNFASFIHRVFSGSAKDLAIAGPQAITAPAPTQLLQLPLTQVEESSLRSPAVLSDAKQRVANYENLLNEAPKPPTRQSMRDLVGKVQIM